MVSLRLPASGSFLFFSKEKTGEKNGEARRDFDFPPDLLGSDQENPFGFLGSFPQRNLRQLRTSDADLIRFIEADDPVRRFLA